LPVSVLGSALFHALVSLTVLSVGVLLTSQRFSVTLTLLPIVMLPVIFLSLGLTWFLAGLGVFVRDIRHLVSLAVQILFFMTPIFIPLKSCRVVTTLDQNQSFDLCREQFPLRGL
jgi:lipopolysaccharide transport system permease protein